MNWKTEFGLRQVTATGINAGQQKLPVPFKLHYFLIWAWTDGLAYGIRGDNTIHYFLPFLTVTDAYARTTLLIHTTHRGRNNLIVAGYRIRLDTHAQLIKRTEKWWSTEQIKARMNYYLDREKKARIPRDAYRWVGSGGPEWSWILIADLLLSPLPRG
jgi:hypothetical protein